MGVSETAAFARPVGSGVVLVVNDLPEAGSLTKDLPVPARALAIGAHPDDIEFGAGATLAKWASAGCEIHHLVLTDGAKGSWDPDRDEASLVALRQQEQREAARRLGGREVGFLGWPDGELRNGVREQYEVCRWIRTVRPDVVLGHDPWRRYRLHPDHRNAGYIVTDALVAARDFHFFADQGLPTHRPKALLLWEADVPNHLEDVSDHGETKVAALLAHRSQYESTMGISPDAAGPNSAGEFGGAEVTVEGNADMEPFRRRVMAQLVEHGRLGGVPLGESFHLMTAL
jgi:LmbE family N-acetylglucosaminyl deacetylase